jgi:regulator of RNase E activity RraA
MAVNLDPIRKLVEFDTPTVANGLERLNVRDATVGYTGPDIRALMPEMGARVGIVVTARMDTTTAGHEGGKSLFKEMLRRAREIARGDASGSMTVFAVIESVGTRPRHTVTIGDGMGTLMRLAGCAGFLTNGSLRDIGGLRDVPLPCWAAGISPMHGELRWLDENRPVVIDGVTIRPGDVIHADENGVLVIPPDVADRVYDQAAAVREMEQALFQKWRSPQFRLDDYLEEE